MKMKQMMARLLAEIRTNGEEMKSIQEEMKAEIRTNNEKLRFFEVLLCPRWISTKPVQRPCKKKRTPT
jgi:hypothetical protein